jgi:hypothetical protein
MEEHGSLRARKIPMDVSAARGRISPVTILSRNPWVDPENGSSSKPLEMIQPVARMLIL